MSVGQNVTVARKAEELPTTLLDACVRRAAVAHVKRELENGRDPDVKATRRETMKALWRATTDGSKVASVVVLWAVALEELGVDELHVEQFVAWSAESRSTVHRRLREFREVWPEYETPNELARLLLVEAKRRRVKVGAGLLVPVA